MRSTASLSRLLCLLVAAVAPALGCDEPAEEDDVCAEMRKCFFEDEDLLEALGDVGDGRYANFVERRDELRAAYGEGGTCYDGDPALCRNRCLCVMRELCQDVELRAEMCPIFKHEGPNADRCCRYPALRAFEERELPDIKKSGGAGDGADGLDDICELPLDARIPEDNCALDAPDPSE